MNMYLKLKKHLFWGVAIRFLFEAYLEMTLIVFIGIAKMDWVEGDFAITYNNVFTIGLAFPLSIMPLFTSVFYGWNIDNIDEDEFAEKFGTLY